LRVALNSVPIVSGAVRRVAAAAVTYARQRAAPTRGGTATLEPRRPACARTCIFVECGGDLCLTLRYIYKYITS